MSTFRDDFIKTLKARLAEVENHPGHDPNNPWERTPMRLAEAALAVLAEGTEPGERCCSHIMFHFNMLRDVALEVFEKHATSEPINTDDPEERP